MLSFCRSIIKTKISVYDGISPALLATISLSQNIKGSTHSQLINSLKKSNIVQSEHILSTLKELDRSLFTHESKVYDNKPNKISKGQNMTDIFSHSIVLNNIQPYLKINDNIKILDIGTGHGYLAFAIWSLAQKLNKKSTTILGIDCYEECIQKCNQIKANLQIKAAQISFKKTDVNELFEKQQKYDVIIGGFFMEPNLSSKLQNLLQDNGLGIWPQLSQNGQGLFITKKNKPKQYLLETLFSQQVVQSSVEDYFISDHAEIDQNEPESNKQASQQEKKQMMEKLRTQRNEKKSHLQQKLKELITKHQKILNMKVLPLKQLQTIPEIKQVLDELKRYK